MNLEPLITLIKEHGLENYQQDILATARPAITMNLAARGQGYIGQSRIGGYPDLPALLSWPTNLLSNKPTCFIVQLNLAELPKFPENPLPQKGMLYLFLDENENHAQQLVMYLGNEPLQPTKLPDDTEFSTDWYDDLVAHTLEFTLFTDLPRWATDDHSELAKKLTTDTDSEDVLNELISNLPVTSHQYTATEYIGKLLGHASGIGHDPREDAFVVREVNPNWLYKYNELRNNNVDLSKAKFWHNLLELHSEDEVNLMFGDAGYLQILIHENDLKKQDFSRVYVNLESS
jgi:uncharacterized protein YwqG